MWLVVSLSARRAWIEREHEANQVNPKTVSLSARRAWIENRPHSQKHINGRVALRKESVDRMFYYADKDADWVRCRSPQGERG